MSKEAKLEKLAAKREEVLLGGGTQKIEKHHQGGKLTARERINLLLDEGSFVELDQFVVHRGTYFGMDKTVAPGEGVEISRGTDPVAGNGDLHAAGSNARVQRVRACDSSPRPTSSQRRCRVMPGCRA